MKIAPFQTEHFFARYEFTTPYQLCNSDCETVTVEELLRMAKIPLSRMGELGLGYTESQGHPGLRRAIAASYEQVEADDVVVLGSPVEGIYLAARACLDPGEEVIVLSPAYRKCGLKASCFSSGDEKPPGIVCNTGIIDVVEYS